MAIRYQEAFGLRDNPFGPRLRWGKVPPHLTVELERRPLLVHRDPGLDELYCEKIPSFKSACESLEILFEANGYSLNPLSRGVASYLVAIQGDRGAGKTTLASRMMQSMLKRTPPDEPAWHVDELLLNSITQTGNEQGDQLKALEARVVAAKAVYTCILVDDIRADAFPFVTQVYDTLREHCVVFMAFTSYDPKMADQIDKSLHSVEHYRIASLTPDDAIAYVAARYQLFRIPSANGISAVPLFPFDESDIRTAVKVKAWSGSTTTGPVNLRLVASILYSALSNRLQEIAKKHAAFDVHALKADELQQLLVKVAQSYSSVVVRR